MWKANGKTTTLLLFLDIVSPKTGKLSLEGTMDLSRDRLILELERNSGSFQIIHPGPMPYATFGKMQFSVVTIS
jgi:hypothetical protein